MKNITKWLGFATITATLIACGTSTAPSVAIAPVETAAPAPTAPLALPQTAPPTAPPVVVDYDALANDGMLSATEWQYARVAIGNEGIDTWQTREVAEAFGAGSCDAVRTTYSAEEFIDALTFAAYGEGNDFYTPLEWATVTGTIMAYMCRADASRLFG
jgi:hypothetical protein